MNNKEERKAWCYQLPGSSIIHKAYFDHEEFDRAEAECLLALEFGTFKLPEGTRFWKVTNYAYELDARNNPNFTEAKGKKQ